MDILKSDPSNMSIIQGISTLDKLIKQFHILTTNPRLISNATQFAHNFWETILLYATLVLSSNSTAGRKKYSIFIFLS